LILPLKTWHIQFMCQRLQNCNLYLFDLDINTYNSNHFEIKQYMNYLRVYSQLIYKAKSKNRKKNEGTYYEHHHIIPKCMGGSNDNENIVLLTAREHYISHWLLVKIYNYNFRLVSAFNSMSRTSQSQIRNISSIAYETARKYYAKYHPCKELEIRNKISNSLTEHFQTNPLQPGKKTSKYVYEERICSCGCGESFIVPTSSKQKCVDKEHARRAQAAKTSKALKQHINSLTRDEKELRIKNSMGTANRKDVGKSISKSKKGKKTNQNKIMGERYAKMTEDEFNDFLLTKKPRSHQRLKTLRSKYLINE